MKARPALLAAAALAVLGALAWRGSGPDAASPASPPSRARPAALVPTPPSVAPALPARNVFEYSDAPPAMPLAPALSAAPRFRVPAAPGPEAPAPPVRLVGLVHRGGQLRAAIAVQGEVVMLARGEASGGYRVLSIDEDSGVRLRGPDGAEMVLAVPDR